MPAVSSSCAFKITFITESAYMSLVGLATHCNNNKNNNRLLEHQNKNKKRRSERQDNTE